MIRNTEYTIDRAAVNEAAELIDRVEQAAKGDLLRWYVTDVSAEAYHVEATEYERKLSAPDRPVTEQHYPGKSAVLNIVPTGVGCELGGYAGDAAPLTSLLAACTDYLITNPNAVNASNFVLMERNVLYTEGYSIDLFCRGLINLHVPHSNRVGLIIEETSKENLDVVFNILNTVRAVYGVDIEEFVITDGPIGGRCVTNKAGAYVGTIDHPDTLLDAAETLIARGVNAIAITSNIQDLPMDFYAQHFSGNHPNPVGGAEAVISHLISKKFGVPAAHAPMINVKEMELQDAIVDPRGAGEMSSVSGLACVLIGLRRAPQFAKNASGIADTLNVNNLLAIVTPASCLGGIPMLYAQKFNIPIIAVKDNHTILDVTQEKMQLANLIEVSSYAEAAGMLMALKSGISLNSISRPLKALKY